MVISILTAGRAHPEREDEGAAASNVQIAVSFTGFQLTIGQSLWTIPEIGPVILSATMLPPTRSSVSPFATATVKWNDFFHQRREFLLQLDQLACLDQPASPIMTRAAWP